MSLTLRKVLFIQFSTAAFIDASYLCSSAYWEFQANHTGGGGGDEDSDAGDDGNRGDGDSDGGDDNSDDAGGAGGADGDNGGDGSSPSLRLHSIWVLSMCVTCTI